MILYFAILCHFFVFVCCSHLNMLVAGKHKYNHKTLHEKFQGHKPLEKGMSKEDVAAKYGVPKNTLSTWVKNEEKLLDSLEKESNIKGQKFRTGNFQMVDKAIFNWFLSIWSQNVLLPATMIQEKALTLAKELNVENFQASDIGRKETTKLSRLYLRNRNLLHQKWLMGGGKRLF